jgi:hypothetical protein
MPEQALAALTGTDREVGAQGAKEGSLVPHGGGGAVGEEGAFVPPP